jgi:hypothetical protein
MQCFHVFFYIILIIIKSHNYYFIILDDKYVNNIIKILYHIFVYIYFDLIFFSFTFVSPFFLLRHTQIDDNCHLYDVYKQLNCNRMQY